MKHKYCVSEGIYCQHLKNEEGQCSCEKGHKLFWLMSEEGEAHDIQSYECETYGENLKGFAFHQEDKPFDIAPDVVMAVASITGTNLSSSEVTCEDKTEALFRYANALAMDLANTLHSSDKQLIDRINSRHGKKARYEHSLECLRKESQKSKVHSVYYNSILPDPIMCAKATQTAYAEVMGALSDATFDDDEAKRAEAKELLMECMTDMAERILL